MKTALCAVALFFLAPLPAAKQQDFQDALLDRMAGNWVLEGTIGGD